MIRQSIATQTLFAELSERLRGLEAARSFASLTGSFARKSVKGREYWYFKTSDGPDGQREYFVGPDSASTSVLMANYHSGRADSDAAQAQISRICAMLRPGGAMVTDIPSAKVIAGLANAGIFRLGAVLVGTQAFIAMGNLLGIRWESTTRTQDIDLAASRALHIVVPQTDADLPKTLESLNMGFLPVPGLSPHEPRTSFKVRGQELRVDLLTPAWGARSDKPVLIPRLKASAQPLEMLDYLLDDSVPVPVVNGGAALVNVPQPARFALHKLLVSGRRQAFEQTKASKDRAQATEMILALHEDRPGDLELATEEFNKRPASWRSRLRRELEKLPLEAKTAAETIITTLNID